MNALPLGTARGKDSQPVDALRGLRAAPQAPGAPSAVDWTVAFGSLFVLSKAVLMLIITGGEQGMIDLIEGSFLFQGLAAVVYAVCLARTLKQLAYAHRLLRDNPLLAALIALAFVSTLWSVEPGITLRRSLALFGTTGVAVFIATHFSARDFEKLLIRFFTVIGVGSLFMVAFFPALGIHQGELHTGDWRGVFTHKNNLGEAMVLGLIVAMVAGQMRRETRGKSVALGILCLGLLIMSRSRASWVAAALAALALPFVQLWRQPLRVKVPALLVVTTATATTLALILANLANLLAMMGRDLTLTGRTVLWQAAIVAGLDRPILGYGYRAFWLGEGGGAANMGNLASQFSLSIGHGHNGFLDLWLEMGIPGLTLFVLLLLRYSGSAIRAAMRGDDATDSWPLLLMLAFITISFASTVIAAQNDYIWVIFVVTMLHQSARRFRLRSSVPSRAARKTNTWRAPWPDQINQG